MASEAVTTATTAAAAASGVSHLGQFRSARKRGPRRHPGAVSGSPGRCSGGALPGATVPATARVAARRRSSMAFMGHP